MANSALKKKITKFAEIAQELRDGKSFNITRLTSLKSLCKDPQVANQFCLYLAKLTQQKMAEKDCPEYIEPNTWLTYQQLGDEAIQTLENYLEDPTQENKDLLWKQYSSLRNLQNQYQKQAWGSVRLINSTDVLLVEKALSCALHPSECSDWGYHVGRNYAERYNPRYGTGLIPESAPMVEDIANFWFQYHGCSSLETTERFSDTGSFGATFLQLD
jgi:hypothetical protein